MAPIFYGGAQQYGMRPGTLSPLLCAGLAKTARVAHERLEEDEVHTAALRERLLKALFASFPHLTINEDPERSLKGCVNIRISDVDAHALLMMMQNDLAASVGSACNAGLGNPPHG